MDARTSQFWTAAEKSPATPRVAPHNIEAEQALLGAILINNEAIDRIGDRLKAEHFFDPLHGRIFGALRHYAATGKSATPITLKPLFVNEEAIGKLTVPAYLGRLAAAATSVINARDYARTIYDLWTLRELIAIGEDTVNAAYAADVDAEAAQQIDVAEARLFALGDLGAQKGHEATAAQASIAAMDMIAAAYQNNSGLAGLATGYRDLDKALGGLAPENLIILAGRPSMGKSALAAGISFNVAKRLLADFREPRFIDSAGGIAADSPGGRAADSGAEGPDRAKCGEVSFYSLEMSVEQLWQRQLAHETEIPAERQRRGDINESEFQRLQAAADILAELPIHIDSQGALTIAQLISRARRRKRLHDTRLIVVDYLQLMASGKNRDNRTAEVTEISMALKALAKELKIPVIALSQLSRNVESREDKRPQLSDLRESGAIEQDADIVMFVYREEYYLTRKEPQESKVDQWNEWKMALTACTGVAEVSLGKHRHGSVGTVKMLFQGEFTRFSDLDSRH